MRAAMGGTVGASVRTASGPPPRQLSVGGDVLCTGECQAIQDVANGWEGFCLGLQLMNRTTTPAACREACCADPNCEVWQWGNPREEYGSALGWCYRGRGLECHSDRFDDFLVLAGQRISHGTVSETIRLELGTWCIGSGMRQANGVRPLSAIGTYKSSTDECQKVCFEDPSCSVWEHSTERGCWYGYSDECSATAEGAETMVAGERVARACGAGVTKPVPTDFVTVFGVIGAVALFMTCCASLLLLIGGARRSGSSELRLEGGEADEVADAKLWEDGLDSMGEATEEWTEVGPL